MDHPIDIFVSSGAEQFDALRRLLPRLAPHGRVHLASSFLSESQLGAVATQVDVVHRPRLAEDPYRNFVLFFIREAHRLAHSRTLLKIDTDVVLREDWFDYVRASLTAHPRAVLLGSHAGSNPVDYDVSGPLVRQRLGSDLRVRGGLKVNGSFCLVDLDFFREHDATFQALHDLIYAFRDGRRVRPCHFDARGHESAGAELRDAWPGSARGAVRMPGVWPGSARGAVRVRGVWPGSARGAVRMRGVCANRQGTASYDNLLGLTAHWLGAGDRVVVRDAAERIRLPDKPFPPSPLKLAVKRLRGRVGIPWSRGKMRLPRLQTPPRGD